MVSSKIIFLQQFLMAQYNNAYARIRYLESMGEEWEKLIEEEDIWLDNRSGIPYPTVWINDRRWFAQNLIHEFRDTLFNRITDRRFSINPKTNSSVLGHLYNLKSAVSACPPGTELPSIEDFAEVHKTGNQKLLGLEPNGFYNPTNKLFVGNDYGYYWTSDAPHAWGKRTVLKIWNSNYYRESLYHVMECSVRPIIKDIIS
jgi:uncharacterized protein (TIGR02145 family)